MAGVTLLLIALPMAAHAQMGSARYATILLEADSGRELSSMSADEPRHPASLTKMMTLYMLFEALRDRRVALDSPVPVSAHAASMSPSKLGLVPGTRLTVEQAILGLVTKSANDAAAALGELLGGSETRFAEMMTLRARALGMTHTTFHNASGLPDPGQVTTARDMAELARHLIRDFPDEYRYFSVPSFSFHGRVIFNHDHMLQTYPGADGLKTGYTDDAGHNLVTSALRGNTRLIGVVLGAGSNSERDNDMTALLDDGFEQFDIPRVMARNTHGPHLSLISHAEAATLHVPPHPQPAHPVEAKLPPARAATRWTVQVGAFPTEDAARHAAESALKRSGDGEIHIESAVVGGHRVWRAQLTGLKQAAASNTCTVLEHSHSPCALIRPLNMQLARS